MDLLNRYRRVASLLFLTALPFCAALTTAIAAEPVQKKGIPSGGTPVVIRSDSLEIDNKKRVVLFTGSVEAQKEDMLIKCQRMVVYYKDRGTEKRAEGAENEGMRIDRIVAKGEVRIDRSDGGSATADEAVYYEDEEKLVLQGKPMVKQGGDTVEGSVITLFLREDRSVVEGGGDQKVRAVLAPRNRKR